MKVILLAGCLLAAFFAKAQDTLVYRNAGKQVVLLREISPTEIRYQRPDLPDGPDYVINKATVEKIIYKNGLVEVVSMPAATAVIPTAAGYSSPEMMPPGKISYRDTKKKHIVLMGLANNHVDPKRRPELGELAFNIRQSKAVQDGTRTGAIVCGGLAIGATFLYSLSYIVTGGSNMPAFYIPPVALGGVALALGGISVAYNIRLKHKRTEFVDLYNE